MLVSRFIPASLRTIPLSIAHFSTASVAYASRSELLAKRVAEERLKQDKLNALKPVRPANAYAFFVKTYRGKTLAEAGEAWKKLPKTERAPFEEMAETNKKEVMEKFPSAPKRPQAKFIKFSSAQFKSLDPDLLFAEKSKVISEKWKLLSELEKNKYAPTEHDWDAWRTNYKAWEDSRLELYYQSKANPK